MPTTEETGTCHGCGKELHGAVEITLVTRGPIVQVSLRETPDCNWTKCGGCGKAVCKACDRFIRLIGRIWKERERARKPGTGPAPFSNAANENGSGPHAGPVHASTGNSSDRDGGERHDS